MFWNVATLVLSAFISGAICSPIALSDKNALAGRDGHDRDISFDNWGGFQSLHGFDNFYGVKNFDGHDFHQVLVKDHELVCRTQEVHIIQQRLLVLQEMAKRIITEQICEVEVQTIVFEQYFSGLHGFSRDLRRVGHHQVSFDHGISNHFDKILNHDGTLNHDDWGFSGHDLGKETIIVKGHNWDNGHSPRSVGDAWRVSRSAWGDRDLISTEGH